MNTKKQVIANYPELKTIINAVINRIGMDSIKDINKHGIQGGYHGFIWYTDTHKFAMRHRKTIISMLKEDAAEIGEEVVSMVSRFGIFINSKMDDEDREELYKYLGMGRCKQSAITNLMAWYAAETVCRMFEND